MREVKRYTQNIKFQGKCLICLMALLYDYQFELQRCQLLQSNKRRLPQKMNGYYKCPYYAGMVQKWV